MRHIKGAIHAISSCGGWYKVPVHFTYPFLSTLTMRALIFFRWKSQSQLQQLAQKFALWNIDLRLVWLLLKHRDFRFSYPGPPWTLDRRWFWLGWIFKHQRGCWFRVWFF